MIIFLEQRRQHVAADLGDANAVSEVCAPTGAVQVAGNLLAHLVGGNLSLGVDTKAFPRFFEERLVDPLGGVSAIDYVAALFVPVPFALNLYWFNKMVAKAKNMPLTAVCAVTRSVTKSFYKI